MQVANVFKFDDNTSGRTPLCVACEEMLADALDHALSESDQTWFDRHISTCGDCTQMLADAQRGVAWLELLKTPRPEPSAHLMERILAQTSGAALGDSSDLNPVVIGQPAVLPSPLPQRSNLLSFRPRMPRFASWTKSSFEPRLAMTAAMAFFSIALTLNMAGVRLDRLNASDLKPSNLKRTFYEANAGAVRYYDNLRVVHVMESRVDNLRVDDSDTNTSTPSEDRSAPTPEAQPTNSQPDQPQTAPENQAPEQKPEQKPGGGMSRREAPISRPHLLLTEDKIRSNQTTPRKSTTKEGGLV